MRTAIGSRFPMLGLSPAVRLHISGRTVAAAVALVSWFGPALAVVSAGSAAMPTIALERVIPGELDGDLGAISRAPSPPNAVRAKPYRRRLESGAPPKMPSTSDGSAVDAPPAVSLKASAAAAPGPLQSFDGLARNDACTGGVCGTGGDPPDANGDVGPNHYVQAVNTGYAFYSKTGTLLASITEDRLWSGNSSPCSTVSQGDPIVLYDALADRWILTHFAFNDSAGLVPPFYQCIAVSKTADPVAGGWWLYPVRMDDAAHPWLNDYSKFGIWHDCLYMAANGFDASNTFQSTIFASFSRSDLYAGAPLTASVGYNPDRTAFTMIPANLAGQSGASIPPGTPAYFVSEAQSFYAYEVRKFSPGPNCGAGGTLSAPVAIPQAEYTPPRGNIVPQPKTSIKLDTVDDKLMQKVQYRRIGGVESLWVTHTFRSSVTGPTGIQWGQIDVTGGTVGSLLQQQNYNPADGLYRFMPSLAVDGQGNMAVGYSRSGSNGTNYPSIAYAGRLATDPPNTLARTETLLIAGGGSQTGLCGGDYCSRWGDYSAMSVDPVDDCTFWLTNEYYAGPFDANTTAWRTRIGSFRIGTCPTSNRAADAGVTVTNSAGPPVPGGGVTYTIKVTNSGPFAITGALVTAIPSAILSGPTWSCSASPGSSCPVSGAGAINGVAINVLNGGTATFTLQATLSQNPPATIVQTASVNVPATFVDPVTSNNSATSSDPVRLLPPRVSISFSPSAIVPGQTSLLAIAIANPNGGAALTGVAFSDALPGGITAPNQSSPACGGTMAVSNNVLSLTGGSIAAGGSCSMSLTVTGAQPNAWTFTISSLTSTESGAGAAPATATITVSKAGVTLSNITDGANPSLTGQPFSIGFAIAATSPATGTPTGAVTISDGQGAACVATLPATSCVLALPSAGTRTLTLSYGGDSRFAASAVSVQHAVNRAATSVTITNAGALAGGSTLAFQPIAVNWSVAVNPPGALGAAMTGTVSVSDGASTCAGAVASGSCLLTPTTAGTKAITATYSSDSNYAGSASAAVSHLVEKALTTIAIISDRPDPSVVATAVTIQVSLTVPVAGAPTGLIVVTDGTDRCTINLPASACTWSPTRIGTFALTATYVGDGAFFGSTSAPDAHTVVATGSQSTLTVTRFGRGDGKVMSDDGGIDCGVACSHLYPNGTTLTLSATPASGSAFTGWLGACTGTAPCTLLLGAASALSATFAPAGQAGGALDVDDNGGTDALTDGLTMVRYLFGLRGATMTALSIGSGARRADPGAIAGFIDDTLPRLDIDGNGRVDALSDGLLIIRYLFGLRQGALIDNAIGFGATRTNAQQIEKYLATLAP